MESPKALRYNRKDRPDENLGGQNLRCSKQRKGKNPPGAPPLNDALLMMWQTKSLQTVGSRCEIDARFEHQNAAKQTERPAGKIQEKRLNPHG